MKRKLTNMGKSYFFGFFGSQLATNCSQLKIQSASGKGKMNNSIFIIAQFSNNKNKSGNNGFAVLAKQWIEKTNVLGMI
jgi:hypothetical protein